MQTLKIKLYIRQKAQLRIQEKEFFKKPEDPIETHRVVNLLQKDDGSKCELTTRPSFVHLGAALESTRIK